MKRRSIALAAASTVAGLAAATVLTQSAQATDVARTSVVKPTVVLVHGAWSDASSWHGVTKRLQSEGYTVDAPAVPLRGLSGDANYLSDYLKTIKGPIVLVGHSYGGSVITQAAAANTNVSALVYIAAFAPDKGETASELTAKFPGSHISDDPNAQIPTALSPVPFNDNGTTGVDLYIKPDKFRDVFLSDRVGSRQANALAAAQRPVTAQALGEPTGTPAWKTIPSWYLVASGDHLISPAAERFMAERAHAHTSEVNAPHGVLLTDPAAVSRVIQQAARTTAK
ncbi:pimeloyl-ACP methyl ester carboxylesterase [Streptomyces aurantiacus]|uniref:alpha/beta hydrolase n=1 Tax=Streptomyces aurantiacus TaxID=47760 RepID=UPI0027912BCD|nr:alpha/beta hydrolase [Streptomyces aurantiacus]MDQ0779032.1 pimeloyl-ACP methyl ester carboxylesterase [Streptomyces aurantiacus]